MVHSYVYGRKAIGVMFLPTMSSSGYTHKIISYGDDTAPSDAEEGDFFAGMGAVVEYYDESGKNVTPMAFPPNA